MPKGSTKFWIKTWDKNGCKAYRNFGGSLTNERRLRLAGQRIKDLIRDKMIVYTTDVGHGPFNITDLYQNKYGVKTLHKINPGFDAFTDFSI